MKQKSVVFQGACLLVGIAFLLTGCGGDTDGGGRTVRFWTFAQNNLEEWKARQTEIEDRFNIRLDLELVAQNGFVQKLQAVMTEGKNVPDVIEWMLDGQLMDADPKKSFVHPLETYAQNSALFSKVPQGRVAWITFGEHIYGLPHDVHPVVLIYNDTLWKEAGVDVATLTTWDDFMTAARSLIRDTEGGKPKHYALPYGDGGLTDTMFMIWQQTGAQILDKHGRPNFTDPEFKAFLSKWLSWKASGVFMNWDWGNFAALLKNGTLCSYTAPDWWVSQVDGAAADGTYAWRVRDLPLYPGGNGSATASWGGTALSVTKTVQDLDFMWQVVEYMQYGNPKIATQRYETGGMLAPLPDAWDDPVFSRPDPRFGGQQLGLLQVRLARELPVVNVGDVFNDAVNDFGQFYSEMQSGKMSIDEGLQKTQETVLQRLP